MSLSCQFGIANKKAKTEKQKQQCRSVSVIKAAALPVLLLLLFLLLFCVCFNMAACVKPRPNVLTPPPHPSCINFPNYAVSYVLALTLSLYLLVSWGPANLLAATRGNARRHSCSPSPTMKLSFLAALILTMLTYIHRHVYILSPTINN